MIQAWILKIVLFQESKLKNGAVRSLACGARLGFGLEKYGVKWATGHVWL